MPRKARLEFAGAVYHLLDRGDRQEAIFRDDARNYYERPPYVRSDTSPSRISRNTRQSFLTEGAKRGRS